jgi:hypothetical protein
LSQTERLGKLLLSLRNAPGITFRKNILRLNKANDDLLAALRYLYDPRSPNNISVEALNSPTQASPSFTIKTIEDLFDFLNHDATGTPEDIATLREFIMTLSPEMRGVYAALITKTLNLNMTIQNIESEYGHDFVKRWSVRKMASAKDYPLKQDEWFSFSLKPYGCRAIYFSGNFYTEEGKIITGLDHIKADIYKYDIAHYFIDGYLVRRRDENITNTANERLTKRIVSDEEADRSMLQFIIVDMVDEHDFIENQSRLTYRDRYIVIQDLADKLVGDEVRTIFVNDVLYQGYDRSYISRSVREYTGDSRGNFIFNRDTPYIFGFDTGTTTCLYYSTLFLRIKGVVEGTGSRTGSLGGFICGYKKTDVYVARGIPDDMRVMYWEDRHNLIGKIAEIKYLSIDRDRYTKRPIIRKPEFICLYDESDLDILNVSSE